MEEKFISQDIQVEILQILDPKDLYAFGTTSKTAFEIANKAWKKKFIRKFGDLHLEEVVSNGITYVDYLGRKTWYNAFMMVSSKYFTYYLDELITKLNASNVERVRRGLFYEMMDLVMEHHWLVITKKYASFLTTVEIKLLSMKNQSKVEEYYKQLFPQTYLDHFSYDLDRLFGQN